MNDKKIAIIGLGYVGLPLAVAFAKKFMVTGFDINQTRINDLIKNFDRTHEVTSNELENIKHKLSYSSNLNDIIDCNIFIVTVPTPINKDNQPDLTPLIKASETVGKVIKQGDIIIYESTVYPGVTEEICVPILEKVSGMKFNKNFYCGYSPERINPGDKERSVTKIKKVTSGSTPEIAKVIDELYLSIITAGTHMASSIKVAEASKVIENTQRDVNIALINELALIFDTMGINTNEVLEAAATKWNFIMLKPGLVGGHCIGVDPYYLTYKAEEMGYKPNLILGARQINNGMGKFVAEKTVKLMIRKGIRIKDSRILIYGITFKENCPDIRNSRVIDIINELKEYGCIVDVTDYWADENAIKQEYNIALKQVVNADIYDAVIVAVAHEQYKLLEFTRNDQVIFDIKSILKRADYCL